MLLLGLDDAHDTFKFIPKNIKAPLDADLCLVYMGPEACYSSDTDSGSFSWTSDSLEMEMDRYRDIKQLLEDTKIELAGAGFSSVKTRIVDGEKEFIDLAQEPGTDSILLPDKARFRHLKFKLEQYSNKKAQLL